MYSPSGSAILQERDEREPEPVAERRRFPRHFGLMHAIAECGGDRLPASVDNISSNGIQIRFAGGFPTAAIDHITLPQYCVRLACEPVWQSGDSGGLRFKDRPYEVTQRLPVALRDKLLPTG